LINEILDLSKVEAGRMELEPSLVSLRHVLEHGLAMVRERASKARIALRSDMGPDPLVIWADELKLKQVVLNLLTNAVKFTGDGGEVRVAASVRAGEAEVLVRDNGIGIAETEQERIFEAFQRGGRRAPAGAEGTGLGLTLSKRIVELHGGRIWLTSRLGAGSTFGFAIPISSAQAPEPDSEPIRRARPPPSPAPDARTILVIEDDPQSADLLSLYLEGAGFAVVVASNGSEGLELAHSLSPAGVILDILLPGLDGWTVLGRLKASPETARLPVVVVTMLDERGKGFALGASEYLVKPVGRDQVLDALARCVPPERDRVTVVVIGDDPDVVVIDSVLAPEGYRVIKAPGGQAALELVRTERPAVVLVDLLMPGVDGFSLVERLRADTECGEIPIVVVTTEEMTSAERERLAGQISYLARESAFDEEQLVGLVDRLAAARPGAREEVS
jgi:CheY-like chemotaxis protein